VSYRIAYRRRAKEKLADVWMNAADPNAVTAAINEVEDKLHRDPLTTGVSRPGGYRLVIEGPIGVLYRVDPQQKRVIIISVGPSGRSQ
jgi:mRNA-degrading endonuclease RelE of RelBE toxin-antitoxin system